MRSFCLATLLLTLLAISLSADTREVMKITAAGQETISTQYVKGKNFRYEDSGPNGSHALVVIQNLEEGKMYRLDPQSRKYVESEQQGVDLILSLAQWITHPPRPRNSGKTVNIYYETVDTGERKQFLGRTAKHLLLRERHVAEPGACDQTRQSEQDGWFLSAPKANSERRVILTGYIDISGSQRCQDTVVRHGAPSSPGTAVFETDGSITRELLELSNDPLDKSLFEIPSGFTKVDAFPGELRMSFSERIQWDCTELEHAFNSWFD